MKDWNFIKETETVHSTWIDVAYTWTRPNSNWKYIAIGELNKINIIQIGRYGQWQFQGIADSIRDGFVISKAIA